MNRTVIDISLRAIFKVIGVLLGLWFLYAIRDIVVLFFFVVIIVMAMAPIIDKWQQYMSRPLAVTLLFTIIIAVIGLIVSLLIPPLVKQLSELANNLPDYASQIQGFLASPNVTGNNSLIQRSLQGLSDQLSNLSSGLVNTTLTVIGGIVTFLTIVVLSAYLLIEEQGIRNFILSLLPLERKSNIAGAINKIGDKLGAWLRGQLLLMVIIGVTTGIWTALLGLPYALPLGLWAGLTEVLPFVGPVIGGIPIVIIAFLDSPIKALIAIALIALIQQVESNFIVPKVMQRSVGLSPVIIILALLIGGKLFGIVGAILAVPVAAMVSVIIQEWPKLSKAIDK